MATRVSCCGTSAASPSALPCASVPTEQIPTRFSTKTARRSALGAEEVRQIRGLCEGANGELHQRRPRNLARKAFRGGDPCPRAWSTALPREVIREGAEYLKEQVKDSRGQPKESHSAVFCEEKNLVSGRIAAKVIHAATTTLLARQDTDHLDGSARGFKHVSTIRLLSREE